MKEKVWNESIHPGIISSTKLYFHDLFVGAKRMSRADFWWGLLGTTIFFAILMGILSWIITILPVMDYYWSAVTGVALAISFGYYLIAIFTASIRRLHDRNMHGWWLLAWILPAVGEIIVIVLMCLPQKDDKNRFSRTI